MRGAVLREINKPLELEEITLDAPEPNYVRVKMAHSGVCHSDLSLQTGVIPVPVPQILGHEGSGIVEEVGPDVTLVQPGDHVILAWQAPCRSCAVCLVGRPEACVNSIRANVKFLTRVNGEPMRRMNAIGTFSDAAVIHEQLLVPIDKSYSLEIAALVGCAVTTGVGAVINTAQVRAGETVTVVGAGGVGLSAIQGARLAGARKIIVVDRLQNKLDIAKQHGATDTVLADENAANHVREITDGLGTDHSVDCVGLPATIRTAFDAARPAGYVTVVGIGPVGEAVPLTIADLMTTKRVQFSMYGGADTRRDFPRLLDLDATGKLDLSQLIAHRITLDDVNDALEGLREASEVRSVIAF
jgi:S-(hydroxymethyl)glutathione dehydrogenase/alcohol dehydrogenase